MSELLLETRGVSRFFEDTGEKLEVLKSVDFTMDKGDLLSITGNSGSGKSTFLNILGLLDHANSGEIFFNGENVALWDAARVNTFRQRDIGFVFQFHHLLPEFTALENLTLVSEIAGRGESKDRAEELLTKVGLADRLKHLPNELSGGERQRVAVARALMNSPALVLADEPSGNLDEKNSSALHDLFLQLNAELGQSFVVVTHDLSLAKLAKNHWMMESGVLHKDISA